MSTISPATRLWTRDLGDIKTIGMGVGTSPVLAGGRASIQADEDEGKESFLVALDAKDGKEAWRVKRPIQASWTTPAVVKDPGWQRAAGHRRQRADHRVRPSHRP